MKTSIKVQKTILLPVPNVTVEKPDKGRTKQRQIQALIESKDALLTSTLA
ncbi:MAG: hypothetical protein RIM23_26185 [Coleofasciculus sp. G3-WIS-01]